MNEEIEEYYEELYRLYVDENQPLERRYRQLRESLERVVRERYKGIVCRPLIWPPVLIM